MQIPDPPDLGRPRWRLALTALVVTLVVDVVLGVQYGHDLSRVLGDTDDAMRLVLVRDLLHGRGWWDQHILRLQPPLGVYMHWSRLLDGGIAALERVFALVVDWPQAEWLTRLIWPLLWVFPAALATLALADRLSERASGHKAPGAVLAAAILLCGNYVLYMQFHPGRVDHHDVQMTFCFLALAGAAQRGPSLKGPVLAGIATGLGLAVGLEALAFEAAIGAAIALRFVFDPAEARRLRAYGLALAATTLLAFCLQTPPWRWTTTACDALALNSVAAIIVAGLAVAVVAQSLKGGSPLVRFIALGVGAAATAGTYIGLAPHCLKGPFADVDPRIKVFWLSHVQEMRPWLKVLKQKPADAIGPAAAPVLAVFCLIWLARRREIRQDSAFRLTAALLLMTMAAGFSGVRMCGYAEWIAIAILAATAADAAERVSGRRQREKLITLIIAAFILTPISWTGATLFVVNTTAALGKSKSGKKAPPPPADHCFQSAPYRILAQAGPPGLVLSEIDVGPFILALTPHSALAAPYHRMSWGMLAARSVLSANADDGTAEAKARALGVRYVVECDAHRHHADRDGMSPDSLQKRLDDDEDQPDWLERVNPVDSDLEVFRVKPLAPKSQ